MKKRGEVFIVSAPSGAGKTTLIQRMMKTLAQHDGVAFSISHTTRPRRQGEKDGRDYHFVDQDTFDQMVADEKFLEWAKVHNHLYGTSYEAVVPQLDEGTDMILEIDVQGAEQVLARRPEAHGIFVLPPNPETLSRRLQNRGLDDPEQVAQRLAVSLWEIKRYRLYEYVIINDDLDRAGDLLSAIILEKRPRLEHSLERVEQILRDFEEQSAKK